MKYVISCLVLVSFFVQNPSFAADESCECPKLACEPCFFEEGITFEASKCGPGGHRTRSCAKPTCKPRLEATNTCPVLPTSSAQGTPVVMKEDEVKKEAISGLNEKPTAGRVKVIQGSVSIVQADGKVRTVSKEAPIHEGDRIESGSTSGAVVHFDGGNKVHVHPDSAMEVQEYKQQGNPKERKALLNLIKGKIRNQVHQKYNGKNSYYRVTTKAATAGVRGTDFLVTYEEGAKLETTVETLSGRVILAAGDDSDSRILNRGEAASFVKDSRSPDSDIPEGKGHFTDIIKISDEELREIDKNSRMDIARNYAVKKRDVASDKAGSGAAAAVCKAPKGDFNQCLWKCENNPGGEKVCRTDIQNVRCLRSRCNANGVWAEETRMPAAAALANCPPQGHQVKDCDY